MYLYIFPRPYFFLALISLYILEYTYSLIHWLSLPLELKLHEDRDLLYLILCCFPLPKSLLSLKLALVCEWIMKGFRTQNKTFQKYFIVIDNMLNFSSKQWLKSKQCNEIFLMIWLYQNSEEQSISQKRFKVTWWP